MHANTLGGVHFDFKKTATETHILEIKNFFGMESKPTTHQMLVGNEIGVARADSARRNNVYDAMELVAMDTAKIFVDGMRTAERIFQSKLK